MKLAWWTSVSTITSRNSIFFFLNLILLFKIKNWRCVDTCCEINCCDDYIKDYYKSNQFIMDHLNVTFQEKLTNRARLEEINIFIFCTCLLIHVLKCFYNKYVLKIYDFSFFLFKLVSSFPSRFYSYIMVYFFNLF